MHAYVALDRILCWLSHHPEWTWTDIAYVAIHDGVPVWSTSVYSESTGQTFTVQADTPDRAVVALAGLLRRYAS